MKKAIIFYVAILLVMIGKMVLVTNLLEMISPDITFYGHFFGLSFIIAAAIGGLYLPVFSFGLVQHYYRLFLLNNNRDWVNVTECVSRVGAMSGATHMPLVAIYQSKEIGAFSVGVSHDKSLICLSSELMKSHNAEEFAAIIAKEFVHIQSGDTLCNQVIEGMIESQYLFSVTPFRGMLEIARGFKENSYPLYLLLNYTAVPLMAVLTSFFIVFEKFFSFIPKLFFKFILKRRNIAADRAVIKLFGKDPMVKALEKMSLKTNFNEFERSTVEAQARDGLLRGLKLFRYGHCCPKMRLRYLRQCA